jgi:hypothetical protein
MREKKDKCRVRQHTRASRSHGTDAWQGVEPPDTTDLLAITTGVGEDSAMSREATSMVVPSVITTSPAAFSPAAASVALLFADALSTAAASFVDYFTATASMVSFSIEALETTTSSSVALDVLGVATRDVAANELGRDMAIAVGICCPVGGGPPTGRSPLQSNLLLCRGWSSSDDTSSSLWMGVTALSFPLLEPGPTLRAPGPPATSIPGIYTPWDSSPIYRVAIPILSKVGSSCSSLLLVAWLEHRGGAGRWMRGEVGEGWIET